MIWLLLRRVPGIAYVVVLCLALLFLAGWSLYRTGYSHGEVDVTREHLQADVDTVIAHLDTAVQETHRHQSVAKKLKQWSDSSRERRNIQREAVDSLLSSLPEPVVTLIRMDDNQVRRDSATIAGFAALDSAWLRERFTRIDLDSLRVQQVAIGVPRQRSRVVPFVSGALVGAAALLLYAAVR